MSHGPGSLLPAYPYGRKNTLREKEIMLTTENDYNDDKERERIGPACELPQSLCSKMEEQECCNKPFLSDT